MYDISVCTRCGNSNKVARTWVENIETRYGGKTKLTHTQWACTDKECQKQFEEKQAEATKKYEDMKMAKEANALKNKRGSKTPINGSSTPEKKATFR